MEEKHICNYGCGKEATNQFKNGKWCCSSNCAKCSSVKERNWRNKSTDVRLKISKKTKDAMIRPEVIEKIKNRKIRKLTEEELKIRNQKYKITSTKNFQHNSEIRKNIWLNSIYRKKQLQILEKCCWNNTERNKKISEKRKQYYKNNPNVITSYVYNNGFPNKQETKLIQIFKDLNLNYEFVGNFSFWVDGKNPDFVDKNIYKVIELFGNYYHGEYYRLKMYNDHLTNKEHEIERISHFKKNGYTCLIIWEEELKDITNVIQKILKFNKIKEGENLK
jgi:very-short-patch-repair endonuclease